MKRAYRCVSMGYTPSCPSYVPCVGKRPRRHWTFADYAACFTLDRDSPLVGPLSKSLQHVYGYFANPLSDGYTSTGFHWILAHAMFLFHRADLDGHVNAMACVSIATKLNDDFSPENCDDVYQAHLTETEKRLFSVIESRVFLQDLSGLVLFDKSTVLKHWKLCAATCNAPVMAGL